MQNLARKLIHGQTPRTGSDRSIRSEPWLEEATVVRASGGTFVVRTEHAECEAKRARSCLVAPEEGEEVLVSFGRGGRCFVLAVLEPEGGKTGIAVDGDLDIKVASGRFRVTAAKGVELASGKDVSVVGNELSITAIEGNVVVQKLSYLGTLLRGEVETIKTIASTCDSVFERVSQRVKRSFRVVDDIDQVRAHSINYAAETNMMLRAENAVVSAEQLVKVDAKQIQLG